MKTALAIVCSLLLGLTHVVFPTAAAGAARSSDACCACAAACCAAQPSSESLPVSATPVSFTPQFQFVPACTTPGWTLPAPAVVEFPASVSSLPFSGAAPLYARICVRLN